MFYVQIALLGIIFGCLYALSATGIVLTYTATGVFNIAHFAVALLAGYLGWQLSGVWGLPLIVVVPVVLLVCGPGLGLLLERVVFRPLQQRRASSSEKLVAALGVTVVLLALINVLWGPGVQGTTTQPVPRMFGLTPFKVGTLTFDTEQVGLLATVLVVAALLYVLFQKTFLGTSIRAVVDRRELAELAAIDANRVSQVAWSLGCTLAALTGLIIAQGTLEPTKIIFFGIETFSVAVVARLTSVPKAILFGFFGMGLARSLLDVFEPFGSAGGWADTYQAIVTNLSSIVLFVALVAFRRLDEVGDTGASGQGLVTGSFGQPKATRSGSVAAIALSLAALVAPFALGGPDLRLAQVVLALIVIFVSIVCITGFSGHLTLGQASIAGLGAFFSARAANALHVPVQGVGRPSREESTETGDRCLPQGEVTGEAGDAHDRHEDDDQCQHDLGQPEIGATEGEGRHERSQAQRDRGDRPRARGLRLTEGTRHQTLPTRAGVAHLVEPAKGHQGHEEHDARQVGDDRLVGASPPAG